MGKYCKKPVIVDAFQWTGDRNQEEDPEWFVECLKKGTAKVYKETEEYSYYDSEASVPIFENGIYMEIETLEGTMRANKGDYIIKGVQGEIYPCKANIFNATYEKV
ncbi:hypothetical protein ABFV99_25565 [Cytobacillus horneckiae]|uniref:hypothetical protein n=1 Tax=Cytobacillus horneckiae TaxID=549687 RepID=UPI002E1E3312|nr:hypothetical protein [Cytobacillus horneckiae]